MTLLSFAAHNLPLCWIILINLSAYYYFSNIKKRMPSWPLMTTLLPLDIILFPLVSYLCLLTSCFYLLFSLLFLTHANHLSALTKPLKPVLLGVPVISLLINPKIISQISPYLACQKHNIDNHFVFEILFSFDFRDTTFPFYFLLF